MDSYDGQVTHIRLNRHEDGYCSRLYALYKLKLINQHVLISCCNRSPGTNYSWKSRLMVFCTYCFYIMALEAVFYGTQQKTVKIIFCFPILTFFFQVEG